jgi:hypothetical protein
MYNIYYNPDHSPTILVSINICIFMSISNDDDDVYLDKLQTRGVKKSIL